VSEQMVSELVAAAQSAATSSNLQLWSIISIQNPELREQVALTAGDQHQVRNAPWFFAFVVDLHRIASVTTEVGEGAEWLDYKEYEVMGIVDVALAAERFVCAAEAQGLGICYIGAMRNDPYRIRELLRLPDRTFCPFGLCLGYPAEDSTAEIKPRLHQDAVWHREAYASPDVSEYDERMRAFYESQKMKGDVTWSMRSARRLSKLSGREVLKPFMEEQGFGRR
jgi:nitroreductase